MSLWLRAVNPKEAFAHCYVTYINVYTDTDISFINLNFSSFSCSPQVLALQLAWRLTVIQCIMLDHLCTKSLHSSAPFLIRKSLGLWSRVTRPWLGNGSHLLASPVRFRPGQRSSGRPRLSAKRRTLCYGSTPQGLQSWDTNLKCGMVLMVFTWDIHRSKIFCDLNRCASFLSKLKCGEVIFRKTSIGQMHVMCYRVQIAQALLATCKMVSGYNHMFRAKIS